MADDNTNTNPIRMLLISLIILVIIFIYLINVSTPSSQMVWFLRVITALAAGAMSMSLSGTINIGTKNAPTTFAEKEPTITAAGSLAVFALVYLFDPINFD